MVNCCSLDLFGHAEQALGTEKRGSWAAGSSSEDFMVKKRDNSGYSLVFNSWINWPFLESYTDHTKYGGYK